MKVHNIPISPKLAKKVITILDLSKASDLDCTSVVVLKECEPKPFIHIGVLSTFIFSVFSLPSLVNEIFEKFVNNSHLDHFEKCSLLSVCQYGFSTCVSGNC